MAKIGIELKSDHPALCEVLNDSHWNVRQLPRVMPDVSLVHQAFAKAYGLTKTQMDELLKYDMIGYEKLENGSLFVFFISELDPEEAGRALQALALIGKMPELKRTK